MRTKRLLIRLFFLAFFWLFISSNNSMAQEIELRPVLSREQAVKEMLENNFGIQLANNVVGIAENNKNILNSGYLPSLSGLAGASYDLSDSRTNFNGALDSEGNERPDNIINDAETNRYNASVNLDYTLFDGLGRYYDFKSLKEQYNLSVLEARETIELTTIQLFSVYYELARITENVSVLEEALKISKDRELRTSYRFDYGQVNKLEVLNAQVDVTTDSINLLNARQQLQNVQRDLNLVLNRDLETTVRVDTTVVFISELQLNDFMATVEDNNVDLIQNERSILVQDYAVKSARSLMLPSIGLSGSYGWNLSNNPASAFFPGTTNNSTSLNMGVNLRWNLFDGGQSITAVKNARILRDNEAIVREQLRQQVFRDLANARGDYDNALYIYRLQEQNVLTNEDNFRRSQERLNLGQITSVEFRQAQLNLLNAETNKNAAKYTAKLAEARLLQLTGQLLNVLF